VRVFVAETGVSVTGRMAGTLVCVAAAGAQPRPRHGGRLVDGVRVGVGVRVNVLVAIGFEGARLAASCTALPQSMRPAPNASSLPGGKRSTAVSFRICSTVAGWSVPFAESISAAHPATCGAAMDVPLSEP
jgi:hypothetical protein